MAQTDRRSFLKKTGLAAGAAVAAASVAGAAGRQPAGANNRLTVALIGCGGMGNGHLRTLAGRRDVRITYLCDPDRNRLQESAQIVQKGGGGNPQTVQDLRRVLERKEIDAVFIATPDHWHGPATILACAAGKHVYVEKPASHNLREGRLMVEAGRRHRKVVQVGTQSRSTAHVREAMRLLREGAIGEVLVSKAWNSQLRSSIGRRKPSPPPAHLNYDLWVGPAPMVPYQSNLLHGIWRWWYAFGTGDMGNDGVHDIDIARWGLGVETHPSVITALGGKYFFDDDQQFPDTQYVVFEYAAAGKNGRRRQLIFEQRIWSPYVQEGYENGNAFYGTRGMLILGKGGGWRLYGPRNKEVRQMNGSTDLRAHHDNFFECVRSGGRPHADIEIGHLSSSLCHLGNIATRVGRVLHFDPRSERITNDREANDMVRRNYREGGHWAAPNGV